MRVVRVDGGVDHGRRKGPAVLRGFLVLVRLAPDSCLFRAATEVAQTAQVNELFGTFRLDRAKDKSAL